ncbi:MAG TPA: YchF-related putative GTPase [Thermoplasmata archaeon]|nr:YchF-related putative GTPase [Thermoplasmata archaeon]
MEVGVVGKPNVGKSTVFNALTLLDVPMAPYPFTTVKPNRGVGAVRVPCPHVELNRECTPGNAACRGAIRWVPVRLIDVPGLVPGAHEGKGLGHEFLDELRGANGFLHVVDASGGTAPDGAIAAPGSFDPAEEVAWLEDELVAWIAGILGRDFDRGSRSLEMGGGKLEEFLARRLTGLAIPLSSISAALRAFPLDKDHPSRWNTEELTGLARELLRAAKPRLVAGNKADRVDPPKMEELRAAVEPTPVVPTCAEAELTLRRAARAGLIAYSPGDRSFARSSGAALSPKQVAALDGIQMLLEKWGGSGVQPALEALVFERLHQVAIFPVEDETHWTDSKGRVLPDVFLVPSGTTVREAAYLVHTELGEHFIRAIDGRTHRALGADHPVDPGQVLRFVARK